MSLAASLDAGPPAGSPDGRGADRAVSSFIETQFPVSRLSKESYKERKANYSQTLTGLGKWWGRKPLVMVRAVILGLLMPASNDPRKDRDVFLALLTMDEEGLRRRKRRVIPLREVWRLLSEDERIEWFDSDVGRDRLRLRKRGAPDRERLQRLVFDRMSYDEKLAWCVRPEHVDGPSEEAWRAINAHLGTTAASLPELVRALGERRFGRTPRVGDAFCGGGSVPFEAARLGCEAFGSDLNPVAALLTWGALHIVGGGEEVAERVRAAQADVFAAVDRQITEWRIEHNDAGWRADAFLYCTETDCPACGWRVPLAPSWVIGEKTRTAARLRPERRQRGFDFDVRSGVDREALAAARAAGTVKDSRLNCPNPACGADTPMAAIRGDRRDAGGRGYGLRLWENDDLVPRPDDVFQERLYCVRWRPPRLDALLAAEQRARAGLPFTAPVPEWVDLDGAIASLTDLLGAAERREIAALRKRDWPAEDRALEEADREFEALRAAGCPKADREAAAERLRETKQTITRRNARVEALAKSIPAALYRSADAADLEREARAFTLLRERFADWQSRGYIPSRAVVPGDETTRLLRERGWTHWHHLFTPRQLLMHGKLAEASATSGFSKKVMVACLFGIGRAADWNSRLSRWWPDKAGEKVIQTFSNQALNTLINFGARGMRTLADSWFLRLVPVQVHGRSVVQARDARALDAQAEVWLTDPPYADAINYHELSEFFLAWFEKTLPALVPDWYTDSKRALAVRGTGAGFRESMVASYRNLAAHMPQDGFQVVMFTHQDASIWADLTLILWAAGLRVTAAWTVGTETPFGVKEGNYVQGTVLMVLRKQTSDETAFLDEVVPEVETEVERQLDSMLRLDDREAPNFSDADYQLAAYAAALRVLTQYRAIEDIDVAYQLSRERGAGEDNPIERIIEDAVKTASHALVPNGLPPHLWRQLGPEEKLYLKGLEVESHGDYRAGVYQEFARGFGVRDYRALVRTGKANDTRLKTASELGNRELGDSAFGRSLVRHALYAVWRAAEGDGDATDSLTWLRTELSGDYWPRREGLTAILRYLASLGIAHWRADAAAARVVAGAVENDHV